MDEFKMNKVQNLPVLEEVPEGATLIAEVDGEFYRVKGEGAGGSSGGRFDVHLNADNTVDKTFDEIKTAYDAGMVVCLSSPVGFAAHMHMPPNDEYGVVGFLATAMMNDGTVFFDTFIVKADNTVDVTESKVSGTVMTTN